MAWRGYPTVDFLNKTQWRRLNHGIECMIVQGNYIHASCAGALKRSWIHSILERSSLVSERARLYEETQYFNMMVLQFALLVGQGCFFMLIIFVFLSFTGFTGLNWTISRTSGDGWQKKFWNGTQFETVCALCHTLFTSSRRIPDKQICWI